MNDLLILVGFPVCVVLAVLAVLVAAALLTELVRDIRAGR